MDSRPRSSRTSNGRWVVEEIGFATGRVLRGSVTIDAFSGRPVSVDHSPGKDPGSDRRRRASENCSSIAGVPRFPGCSPRSGFLSSSRRVEAQASGSCVGHQSSGLMILIRSELPPMPETTQGSAGGHRLEERVAHPFGHARQDEDIRRAEVIGRIGHGAHELNAIGDAELGGQFGQRLRGRFPGRPGSGWPRLAGSLPGPGLEQERQVLLRVQPAREDDSRAGKQVGSRAGWARGGSDRRRRRWPCGQSDLGNAQLQPLALDLGGDRREGRVPEDDAAQQGTTHGCGEARRPRRSSPSWPAAPGSESPAARRRQAGGHGFPECLVGVDHVELARAAGGGPESRPTTKLSAKRGPRSEVRTQRWMKIP